MAARRATWRIWHVRAEAWRQIRSAGLNLSGDHQGAQAVVEAVVAEVLEHRCVVLPAAGTLADRGLTALAPPGLRRRDGTSVYEVAGSARYTSRAVLDAERRLLAAAARTDGRTADPVAVEVAVLELAANGVTLNAGQVALVRAMATSPARLQLAIAPAGTGKTTAMRALAHAWAEAGGHVLGLAPSAAAAAGLRDQLGAATDTLAKLLWSLHVGDLPDWADAVGPSSLLVIDEAAMADTLSLDAVVAFALGRGASVRLVGDDAQLAAVGAGGVLRDIADTHGALRLQEVVRFTDPAEAAASLALREGLPEAIGYYLDHDRVHVGDTATITDQVFTAWASDRAAGLDAVMLAPTRDLVADLNHRARTHRLTAGPVQENPAEASPVEVGLADGNRAGAGDVVITRLNERRVAVSATDWVKNGDRWHVVAIDPGGGLRVRHLRHHLTAHLPAAYVAAHVDLGYATTTHTAQGITADTMHGLLTGAESRQQLYTMTTRGRLANHLYLEVVGDGDPHSLIHPAATHPATAADVLAAILARDEAPVSASTAHRIAHEGAVQLGPAVARYRDALTAAADHRLGPVGAARLDRAAEALVPGLTSQAAWPTLRAHLTLITATVPGTSAGPGADPGADAVRVLTEAATEGDLATARDRAAVLDWRLDPARRIGTGPLPWLPAIPHDLATDPVWGPYLAARAAQVSDLAARTATTAETRAREGVPPAWATHTPGRADPDLVGQVTVWRAAHEVPDSDRCPTGPPQLGHTAAAWQHHLDTRLRGRTTADAGQGSAGGALDEWGPTLTDVGAGRDLFTPVLADRLAALARTGLPAARLLRSAADEGSLPDDHAAAALWWRITTRLGPATTTIPDHDLTTDWTPRLADLVGPDHADRLQASRWWPALVAGIDTALARGWTLPDLLHLTPPTPRDDCGDDSTHEPDTECAIPAHIHCRVSR